MAEHINFPDGTWTYKGGEGEMYGQHYKGAGACGFVRWHLMDNEIVYLVRLHAARRKTDNTDQNSL